MSEVDTALKYSLGLRGPWESAKRPKVKICRLYCVSVLSLSFEQLIVEDGECCPAIPEVTIPDPFEK